MFQSKVVGLALVGLAATWVAGCGPEEEGEVYALQTGPLVEALETNSLMVGEPLNFYGQNFLSPENGKTQLVFDGIFYAEDGVGGVVPREVSSLLISPVYDGEFQEGGQLNGQVLRAGTRALRWNRFALQPIATQSAETDLWEALSRTPL